MVFKLTQSQHRPLRFSQSAWITMAVSGAAMSLMKSSHRPTATLQPCSGLATAIGPGYPEPQVLIRVCLKIVYPSKTQWLMIIIPTKWLFHWGVYPIFRHTLIHLAMCTGHVMQLP